MAQSMSGLYDQVYDSEFKSQYDPNAGLTDVHCTKWLNDVKKQRSKGEQKLIDMPQSIRYNNVHCTLNVRTSPRMFPDEPFFAAYTGDRHGKMINFMSAHGKTMYEALDKLHDLLKQTQFMEL